VIELHLGDRVCWRVDADTKRVGRIIALVGVPQHHGTMVVEWSDGGVSKGLPQRIFEEPRWSLGDPVDAGR
jgi:hypothetical protein